VAATAIAVGVLANTAMKLGLAIFFGSPRFRAIAGGALALMLVALGGALLVLGGRESTARSCAALSLERLRRVDNRRMDFLRLLFSDFARDAGDVEARSLLVFIVWVGQPLIAAEHGSRSRRDAVRAALDFVLT
jgi:hypothetical protein